MRSFLFDEYLNTPCMEEIKLSHCSDAMKVQVVSLPSFNSAWLLGFKLTVFLLTMPHKLSMVRWVGWQREHIDVINVNKPSSGNFGMVCRCQILPKQKFHAHLQIIFRLMEWWRSRCSCSVQFSSWLLRWLWSFNEGTPPADDTVLQAITYCGNFTADFNDADEII